MPSATPAVARMKRELADLRQPGRRPPARCGAGSRSAARSRAPPAPCRRRRSPTTARTCQRLRRAGYAGSKASRPRRRTAPRRRPAAAARPPPPGGSGPTRRRPAPARKAPSANETPKSSADAERDPERHRQHGEREQLARARRGRPGAAARAPRARRRRTSGPRRRADLPSVSPTAEDRPPSRRSPVAEPPSGTASAGRSTRTSTVKRSSTISQPTAIRPWIVSSRSRSISARRSTTVLATESARPSTRPAPSAPAPAPWRARRRARSPPRSADRAGERDRRARRAGRASEKWMPTPNISRITPISASCGASPGRRRSPG